MKQRRLAIIVLASIALGSTLAVVIGYRLPILWVDVSPIYEKWDRPMRPPHPIEIYRPPREK